MSTRLRLGRYICDAAWSAACTQAPLRWHILRGAITSVRPLLLHLPSCLSLILIYLLYLHIMDVESVCLSSSVILSSASPAARMRALTLLLAFACPDGETPSSLSLTPTPLISYKRKNVTAHAAAPGEYKYVVCPCDSHTMVSTLGVQRSAVSPIG